MVTLLKAVLFVLGFRFAEGGGGLGASLGPVPWRRLCLRAFILGKDEVLFIFLTICL